MSVDSRPSEPPSVGGAKQARPPLRWSDAILALRIRNFRLFWFGQLVSGIGTWMQTVALAWLVVEQTHSPVALGTITMLQFLPILLFSLPAGVVADRIPKRRLMIGAQTLAALQALALGVLVAVGWTPLWALGVLAFVLGLTMAFNNPAQQAFVSEMVEPSMVPGAIALNSAQFNGARMLGSALGGVAVAQFGVAFVFFVNATSFTAALGALAAMRARELHSPKPRPRQPKALRDGFGYALHTPPVLFVLVCLAVVGTVGFNWPVALPLIATDVLGVQAVGFGLLFAAFGVGSLAAAVALTYTRAPSERRLAGSGVALAVLLVLLGVSHSYAATAALMVLAGVSGTMFTTTANTRLQLIVPDQLRGRIMSMFVLLMGGSTPIGSYVLGYLAATLGISHSMVVFGVVCALGVFAAVSYRSMHPTAEGDGAVGTGPPHAPSPDLAAALRPGPPSPGEDAAPAGSRPQEGQP